ncbi:helix-turn-helix domain-containing protein [Halobacillus seohaensis]|uniref:Helix-turn-helix domain-containing protein n=1 Tax=Halobacillus seohaensis TaxID=447421 RepID=A0ABW2ESF6_9BACI
MEIKQIFKLQQFKSVKEMDLHVRAFLFRKKEALSKGNMCVLKFIWRYSVKYPGVSFAKIDTIVTKTGFSRRTVNRTISLLEQEGILKRVETIRANGKRGVNILLILPQEDLFLPDSDTPNDTLNDTVPSSNKPTWDQPLEPINSSEAKKKRSENSSCKPVTLDHTFIPSFIPTDFVENTRPFFNPTDVLSAWRTVESAYRQVNLTYPLQTYLEPVIEIFKQSVFAEKHGMIKKSFLGYYYGGMINRFKEIVRREVMDDPNTLYYDWLEAE